MWKEIKGVQVRLAGKQKVKYDAIDAVLLVSAVLSLSSQCRGSNHDGLTAKRSRRGLSRAGRRFLMDVVVEVEERKSQAMVTSGGRR